METWQSAGALARPVPLVDGRVRGPDRGTRNMYAGDFKRAIRRALFSSANVLLCGDTDQAEPYLRSVLETRLVTMNGGRDSPEEMAGVLRGSARSGIVNVLIRNVDRMPATEQFALLDLLEGDRYRASAASRRFRLICTAKDDLERTTGGATGFTTACGTAGRSFLPSLLLRIGTISLHVPPDFFEVMSSRQRRFSTGTNGMNSRWEGARV